MYISAFTTFLKNCMPDWSFSQTIMEKDLEQLFASSGLGKLKPKHISKVTAMKKNHMQ